MTRALDGLRVVELSSGMAGAMAGMVLVENGANVIKVEPPSGDPTRGTPGFHVWNREKRSVVLDLRTQVGSRQMRRLLDGSDALIDALRPGATATFGLDWATLQASHPHLVDVVITGFGERGPLRDRPGYETMVAAISGRMATLNGYRSGPIFTPVPIASFGAAMLATQGLLAAVLGRAANGGRGRRVHTSLLHALVAYDMTSGMGHRIHTNDDSGRTYGVMQLAFMTAECADGRYIQMCSRQPHLYRSWMRLLGLEHLYDDPAYAHMPDVFPSEAALAEVQSLVADRMRTRSSTEWLEDFATFDVGGDPFLEASEFLHHEQARATGRVMTVEDDLVGTTRQIGPLGAFSDTPACVQRGAPALGADTDEVLAEAASRPAPPVAGRGTDRLPLHGITVVEAGYFYAAPFAMTLLAEMGARVIKVEGPTGDPARRNWLTSYTKETPGKESVVADLKTPEGQHIVHRLVERADVFLHNFRPGVPEKLTIGAAEILALNPRLVYVYSGCYGSTGPWATRPGFHSSPNAIVGAGIIEAGIGNRPINRTYGDPAAALATAACALVGLAARQRTGRGQYLETTMLASLGYAVSSWSIKYAGRPDAPMPDSGQHGFSPVHRLYETSDGWVFVGCVTAAHERALLQALGITTSTEAAIRAALATRRADDWAVALGAAGVPAARADGIDHADFMLHHPHMQANGLSVEDVGDDGRPFWRSSTCIEFDGVAPRLDPALPLGFHTTAVLTELGYTPAEIEDLERRGITRAVGHGLPG